jgi:hypothetical protein
MFALRNRGVAADAYISGSVRKRFDKSNKIASRAIILVVPNDDGYPCDALIEVKKARSNQEQSGLEVEAEVAEILQLIGSVETAIPGQDRGLDFQLTFSKQ